MRYAFATAALLAASQAARIPSHRAGLAPNAHEHGNPLLSLESEIERLEEKLQHDLEELEGKLQHDRPHPYHRPSRPSYSWADGSSASESSSTTPASSLVTSAPTTSLSLSSISYITSVANTTAALQSLSSVAANLSSIISSVSSVNATITLATSTSSSTLVGTGSSFTETTAVVSPVAPYSTASSSSAVSASPVSSSNSTSIVSSASSYSSPASSIVSSDTCTDSITLSGTPYPYGNSTAPSYPTGSAYSSGSVTTTVAPVTAIASSSFNSENSTTVTSTRIVTANSTSAYLTGTASSFIMAPTTTAVATANITSSTYCSNLCSALKLDTEYSTQAISCQAIPANQVVALTGGQATAGCGSPAGSFSPAVDVCRVTLSVTTSGESEAYMEVWLPNNSTEAWNGRTLSTDNGGSNGCVHYVDMSYVTSLGFAAIGDNGGHNSSAFDGGWMYFQNEAILDWVYRARHAATEAGKQVIDQFYGKKHSKSYYLGCSTGGQQGLHSAQHFPDDFDGIIAGSAAADFNHLQAWSGRFVQLTGLNSTDPRFLTADQWIFVQSYIFDQCDAALDGVDDGILEDPTICQFNASAIPVCEGAYNSSCLTSTQISTVYEVFTELYNEAGELLYPQLLYGSQVDAFRLGQLSGSVQGIAKSWYGGGVWNDSNYNALNMNQTDYAQADALDALHGNVSGFSGDLSAFHAAGKKLLMYHGMADPLVSGGNSQRYYLKVAKTLGLSNTQLDPFLRYFRISGMAHCGVGGISGAGAWMFGQSGAAAVKGVEDNVIWNMVDWVENGNAPDTITGTKFWYDTPSLGLEFQRPHCRFPYRTTYSGSGDWTNPSSWSCKFIDDWQQCAVGAHPRLCNVDGSFN